MSIDRNRIVQLIQEIRQEKRAEKSLDDVNAPLGPYHLAAAVLTRYHDRTLRPIGAAIGTSVEDVLHDSSLVPGDSAFPWTLRTPVRRRALEQMHTRAVLQEALATNPARPRNTTQELLEAYIRGDAPPLHAQTLDQLISTYQVIEWLDGIVDDLPMRDAVRKRHELMSLLEPFYELAGMHFFGRKEELHALREYVGVLDPSTNSSTPHRRLDHVTDLRERPALVIYGVGGVGKSSLVSRFIWEHTSLPNAERFPWTYIDFDRSIVTATEPLTLMLEAIRQLGIQYPEARASCEGLRQSWEQKLAVIRRGITSSPQGSLKTIEQEVSVDHVSTPTDWKIWLEDLGSLLLNLRLSSDPFLFVLDTFEEAQYHGEAAMTHLCDFLRTCQAIVPLLRIVISGRAQLVNSLLPTRLLEIGDFDTKAAQEYLRDRGISPPEQVLRLVQLFGGNPLTLSLVVRAWHREGAELLTLRVQKDLVQAQLFRRNLKHIHYDGDERLERIAYPGLILRRITPAIIREVLAEPCGITIVDDADAEQLFLQLRREIGLVIPDGDGVRHRPDVRRIMLQLLRAEETIRARQIEEAAILHHANRDGLVDRAEEIYHLLALQQPLSTIEARWVNGLQDFLMSAPEELELNERVWLKQKLGQSISVEDRAQANLQLWEREAQSQASALYDQGRYNEALRVLNERGERSSASPLYLLEAQINERLGRHAAARQLVDTGFAAAEKYGNRQLAIALALVGIRLDLQHGEGKSAVQRLNKVEDLLGNGTDYSIQRVETLLYRVQLAPLELTVRDERYRVDLLNEINALSDQQAKQYRSLMSWVVASLGRSKPEILPRFVRLIGLATQQQQLLRALGRALADWDQEFSQQVDKFTGSIAREAGLLDSLDGSPEGIANLTEVWTVGVLSAEETGSLDELIAPILATRPISPKVCDALLAILRQPAEVAGYPLQVGDSAIYSDVIGGDKVTGDKVIGDKITIIEISFNASTQTSQRYGDVDDRDIVGGDRVGGDKIGGDSITFFYDMVPRQRNLDDTHLVTLRTLLLQLIPNRDALANFVQQRLSQNIDALTLHQELQSTVLQVVQRFAEQGNLVQLLLALRDAYPDHIALRALAEQLDLAPPTLDDQELEALLHMSGSELTVESWRAQLGRIEAQVCQIEAPRGRYSGFLVGPDIVLTSSQLLLAFDTSERDAVHVLFDCKRAHDGSMFHPGMAYRLHSDWLVTVDQTLQYVIIRLADQSGLLPIGSWRAEYSARLRGWIDLNQIANPAWFDGGGRPSTTLLHFPGLARTSVVVDSSRMHRHNRVSDLRIGHSRRITYSHNTRRSSAGAPCFTIDWSLLAVDRGSEHWGGSGISALWIRDALEKSGVLAEITSQQPPM